MNIIPKFWEGTPGLAGLRNAQIPPSVIVYHWTANPRATAQNEFAYRNSRIDTDKVSWHYTIGQDGIVLQHMEDERPGWHCSHNWYNTHSIGIECCPLDVDGNFSDATYQAMVDLGRHLKGKHSIREVLRHDDCRRKANLPPKGCPRYFCGPQGDSRWSEFDPEFSRFVVFRAVESGTGQIKGLKTVHSGRTFKPVILDDTTVAQLRELQEMQHGLDEELIFYCSSNGQPHTHRHSRKKITGAKKRAGVRSLLHLTPCAKHSRRECSAN